MDKVQLKEAVRLAESIVKSYTESADDFGMTLEVFIEKVKWPRDYLLALAVIELNEHADK